MVQKWEDENDVQELDNFDDIFEKFNKPKIEEAKQEELAQSTVLFCADVIKMEEKVVKSKKKLGSIVPESQVPQELEASMDKDANHIFVHHSMDKEDPQPQPM